MPNKCWIENRYIKIEGKHVFQIEQSVRTLRSQGIHIEEKESRERRKHHIVITKCQMSASSRMLKGIRNK